MDIQIPILDELKQSFNFRVGRRLSQRPKGTKEAIIGSYRLGTFKLMKEKKSVMDLMEKFMRQSTF